MIQNIRTVRCRNHDDAFVDTEAVHLNQQLIQRLFSFIVAAAHTGATLPPYRINFINENDTGSILFGLVEQITHTGCADAHKHLHKVRTGNRKKRHAGFACHSPGKQRLAGTRRSVQQHAFGNFGTQRIVPLGMF